MQDKQRFAGYFTAFFDCLNCLNNVFASLNRSGRIGRISHKANIAIGKRNLGQNANGAVTLSWTPPTTNTDGSPLQGLNGYVIAYGQVSGQYTESVTITNPGITSAVIEQLVPATWHFAVKATTDSGAESDYSVEAVKTIM